MGRDFLAPHPSVAQPPIGVSEDYTKAFTLMQATLEDIRRELMKQNPEVLAFTRVQGLNTIAISDTQSHRVFFEVGGKPVTIYALWAYSTFSGNCYLSINSMATGKDGLVFASGDQVYLPLAVDSVSILSDGSAALPVNTAGASGGLFLYGFTIPDYDRNRSGM